MSTLVLDDRYPLTTRELMAELDKRGIDSRPFFHPLSSLPAYQALAGVNDAKHRNVVSYRLAKSAINLPSALNLTEAQVDRVCEAIRAILGA
jgi:perosamine synthetase